MADGKSPHPKASSPKITITDGAYQVEGGVPLYQDVIAPSADGTHLVYRRVKEFDTGGGTYLLCRCGRSANKPFCDFSHALQDPPFDSPEVADRRPYAERARLFQGQDVKLYDDGRCAFARLCHYNDKSVWQMAREKGTDLKLEEVEAAWHCPTGRLVAVDGTTGETYEQEFEPSIIVIEDSGLGCSGPLFVRGGIPLVGQDGFQYEVQNRYSLCRCGQSRNMPFCDATHHHQSFQDGFEDVCHAEGTASAEKGELDTSFVQKPEDL